MDYQEIMLMRDNKAKEEAKSIIREHAERQKAISEEVDKNAIWNKLASLGVDDDEFLRFKESNRGICCRRSYNLCRQLR